MAHEKLQIIRSTWKRLRSVLRMFVKSEQGPKGVTFAAMLVLLMDRKRFQVERIIWSFS